ncbi:MAG: hypothetical protein A2845_01290 [Candidatus Lloydbacteria bacterium RIFCSPHIGHO2_01_FULL_49_22]|uniref:Uncharacterized protein n=1 Tax=Candidatus Lloydbacteria bacterium RIFCSPHIGHO2_01_FULL_49_22 TaxID=1798658 RepID=A0A1G2CXQ1_9BACT|nr:MAG: hypothetical protein A2845_01290 [Candidatus Lloydbacteria bacterium RIFCSPHIGHO2_01_FULL_49_22]OGZ09939.1 MAG: hypothetical protein A3C14_04460 [Candidatus Lloydbacteria bacterium RIFCSPHIGHO2_02_FULL_50_18]
MINRYLTPVFLMILSGAVYVIWVDAPYKDIAAQQAKAEVLRGYIADADNAQEELQKIAAQYDAFPPDGDRRLQVLLPKEIDTVRLIIDVNEIAARHGMGVNDPMVGKAATDESRPQAYVPYSLSFKTTATYDVFRDFLADLERSLALRDIVTVEFSSVASIAASSGSQPPDVAIFNFSIHIVSYGLH